MIEERKTDTTIFLMPVLDINRSKMELHKFMDSFLDDVSRDVHHEDSIYILFKPDNLEEFEEFLEQEKERYKEIVDDYDYIGGYVIVVYKFPKEFLPDMQLILEGKYSKTSNKFKNKFLQVIRIVDESGQRNEHPSLQWMIFKKADAIRESWAQDFEIYLDGESEVWSRPDMEREVLDIDKIRKKEEVNVQ